MGEVIQRTGLSERTVYRLVTEGKIRQAQRPIPGRRPLSIFHPDDVAALETQIRSKGMQVLPPLAQLAAIHDSVTEEAGAIRRQDWPLPLYLTEDEAVTYTGLGKHYLKTAVTWKPIGPRRELVCKRADLDAL